ncbi:helix-turn-helix domain-containing protein [Desulfitobacterium sp.]|uniref:helix-turn-helix domain-containing protein n=1 Tax=Desulfitobacterium sp. TaxID=49981 RepID=UPI002B61DCDA|nr:helix-turn-helix domain-containing protein [Desulfitobacterium sp.]HVJ50621.1 helix-turn-helix domain-containing protein [Desulfitobacterium sp.]
MGYFSSLYSSELPHRARAVYMYLHDRSDKDGKCYPAIGTIAKELKLSRSTVKRAIADLVKSGRMRKEQRWRENGGKGSNLYYLMQTDLG